MCRMELGLVDGLGESFEVYEVWDLMWESVFITYMCLVMNVGGSCSVIL